MGGKLFIEKNAKGMADLEPEVHVSAAPYEAVSRLQSEYFLKKFGTVPAFRSVTYPSKVGPIVDKAFVRLLAKHNFQPHILGRLPRRGGEKEPYYYQGSWITYEPDIAVFVEEDGDGNDRTLSYEAMAAGEKTAIKLLEELKRMIDKQFNNKVIVLHDKIRILNAAEIDELNPGWAAIKSTIDEGVAYRVENVVLPFFDRVERFEAAGVAPRLGILMHGGPGTGKTYLIRTLIKEFAGKATVAHLSSDQFYTRSGQPIRTVFSFLQRYAPVVVILEDVELLARSRDNLLDSPNVQALLDIMDGAVTPLEKVIVIATTNVPDQIDQAFKRPGRFDEVWEFGPPSRGLAVEAVRGYFSKSGVAVPESLVAACGDAGLSYASLRFVATDIIRRSINEGRSEAKIGRSELAGIIEASVAGVEKHSALGFTNENANVSVDDRYDD